MVAMIEMKKDTIRKGMMEIYEIRGTWRRCVPVARVSWSCEKPDSSSFVHSDTDIFLSIGW